jgi:UDP-GlcNAc3NAcA epimerase
MHLIDPVGYLDMVMLEKNARLVATDSGGVQKEAFFYRVPCVTLREETEWVESIELSWNVLAPPIKGESVAEIILSRLDEAGREGKPYGDGHAAEKIASILLSRANVPKTGSMQRG